MLRMDAQPRLFQISLRTLLEIVAAVAVILAFMYQRPATSARYHYISSEHHGLIMYDSVTGRFWQRSNNEWNPYEPPPGIIKSP